jgi:hypothetical protein
MADVYLMRARLFGDTPGASDAVDTGKHYPWISEIQDLKTARQLIEKHGYWRRKGELEDAEAALLKKGGR